MISTDPPKRLAYIDGQIELTEQMIRDLHDTLKKLKRERLNTERLMLGDEDGEHNH